MKCWMIHYTLSIDVKYLFLSSEDSVLACVLKGTLFVQQEHQSSLLMCWMFVPVFSRAQGGLSLVELLGKQREWSQKYLKQCVAGYFQKGFTTFKLL